MSRIAGVLLAAGGSARMGSPKQLLQHRGMSLVRYAALSLCESRADPCLVVVGAGESGVAVELAGLPLEIVSNPAWREGVGGSISRAIEALGRRSFDAVLITLADQPLVTRDHLDALIQCFEAGEGEVVASEYAGTRGAPALFGSGHFAALRALDGDRGAKPLLARLEGRSSAVPFEPAAVDVDRPEDLERLQAEEARLLRFSAEPGSNRE